MNQVASYLILLLQILTCQAQKEAISSVLDTIVSTHPAEYQPQKNDTDCNYTCDCSQECDCIPQVEYMEPPVCPDSDLTLDDGVKIGWKFAPVLYHHPLEWSHLSDPLVWAEAATLFDPVTKLNTSFQELNMSKDSWTDWTQVLPRTWLSLLSNENSTGVKDNAGELLRGDPFVDGKSTARVFFTAFDQDNLRVFDYHNAWVFTYHLFYPFNGCSNQLISIIEGNQYKAARYYMCPEGVHEGDWERVTVYVCKANQKIRRVQYAQHSWVTEYDCPDGKCPFTQTIEHKNGENISHPTAYSGLFSHASYPYPSDMWIYQKVRVDYLANMDGFYVIDRARRDENKKFVPEEDNIVYLPRAELMDTEDPDQVWGLYTGGWGASVTALNRSVTCMDANFKQQYSCNATSVFGKVLKDLLGQYDYADQIHWTIDEAENKTASQKDITGPLNRDYAYIFNVPRPAPLWDWHDSYKQIQCPFHRYDLGDVDMIPREFRSIDVSRFIWGMVLGVLLGGLVLVIVLLVPILTAKDTVEKGYNLIFQNDDLGLGSFQAPNEQCIQKNNVTMRHRNINLIVYWMFFALALFVIGVVLISIGIDDLFDALNKIKDIGIWDDIRNALITLLVVMAFLDLCVFIIGVFLQTSQSVVVFGITLPAGLFGISKCCERSAWQLHAVCAGLMVILINVCLLIFAFGFMVWVGRLILSEGCHLLYRLVTKVGLGETNFCLDLSNVGLKIYCGEDVADFCAEWNSLRLDYISWGSFPLLLSHLMFMVVAIVNYCDARSQTVSVQVSCSKRGPTTPNTPKIIPSTETTSHSEDVDPNIFDPNVRVMM